MMNIGKVFVKRKQQRMIRWYDYLVAFLAADFMWANIQVSLFSGVWWVSILGGMGVYFVWSLWNDTYIPFRVRQEDDR